MDQKKKHNKEINKDSQVRDTEGAVMPDAKRKSNFNKAEIEATFKKDAINPKK